MIHPEIEASRNRLLASRPEVHEWPTDGMRVAEIGDILEFQIDGGYPRRFGVVVNLSFTPWSKRNNLFGWKIKVAVRPDPFTRGGGLIEYIPIPKDCEHIKNITWSESLLGSAPKVKKHTPLGRNEKAWLKTEYATTCRRLAPYNEPQDFNVFDVLIQYGVKYHIRTREYDPYDERAVNGWLLKVEPIGANGLTLGWPRKSLTVLDGRILFTHGGKYAGNTSIKPPDAETYAKELGLKL